MPSANKRGRYIVTSPLIGWAPTQNDPWYWKFIDTRFTHNTISSHIYINSLHWKSIIKQLPHHILFDITKNQYQQYLVLDPVIVQAPKLQEQGWGLLCQFPPFRYFPNSLESPKHMLAIEYHFYIWQVSPQLSCGDTCQIWMWLKEYNRYFYKIKNFACREISQRSFSNPHTRTSKNCNWHSQKQDNVFIWFNLFLNHIELQKILINTFRPHDASSLVQVMDCHLFSNAPWPKLILTCYPWGHYT